MAELKDANANPWYVLMTLYGEHDGMQISADLDQKNRRVWNAWSCQDLTDEEAAGVAADAGVDVSETRGWANIAKDVEVSHQTEMLKRIGYNLKYPGLPQSQHAIDLSEVEINTFFRLSGRIFAQSFGLNSTQLRGGSDFSKAVFLENFSCHKTMFHSGAKFLGARFEGFAYFGDGGMIGASDFSDAVFKSKCDFWAVAFDESANFNCAKFELSINLDDADFRSDVDFSGAKFACVEGLKNAKFEGTVSFSSATFSCPVDFTDRAFLDDNAFDKAVFYERVIFDGARFLRSANFGDATFKDDAIFSNVKFEDVADFTRCTFEKMVDFSDQKFPKDANFGDALFVNGVIFSRAVFSGFVRMQRVKFGNEDNNAFSADFIDCQFEKPTSFREAEFRSSYPILTGAVLHQNTDFTADATSGKVRYWPKIIQNDLKAARESCAKIRHAVDKQGLPEDAHFFFRREMEFARQAGPLWKVLHIDVFDALSEYGYSLWRPLTWLFVVWALGVWVYATATTFTWNIPTAMGYSFSAMFKFLGFQRTYLFEETNSLVAGYEVFAACQTLAGFILLFFLGLGLRTRFRMR